MYLYFSKTRVEETKNAANSMKKPLNDTQTAVNITNYSSSSRENKTEETSEAENTTSYKVGVNKTAENVPSNFNKSIGVTGQGYPRIACYYLTDINLSKIENRSFAVLVLEFEEGLNAENLKKLKELNGLVLAYINFGYAEAWRDYWPKIRGKSWVHSRTEYKDEYYVEYWREEWHKIILKKVDEAFRLGFDGVYFDNMDACTVLEEEKPKWARGLNLTNLMIKSIGNLSSIIKERYGASFKVYVNIGSALRLLGDSRFLQAIDGVLREEVWYTVKGSKSVEMPAEEKELALKYLIKAREANKTVIIADFVDSAERAGEFCMLCWSLGFIPVPQPVWAADYSQPPPEDWCKNEQSTENKSVVKESRESKIRSIPWGAMYVPSEYYGFKGISGVVAYYRGAGSVARLLSDLEKARKMNVKVKLSLV